MAHKGRVYPVWFRRDLSVSVNRHLGMYPQRYELTLSGFFSTIFNLEGIDQQKLNNNRKDDTTIRRWTGDFTNSPPLRVQPSFEVIDTDWGAERIFTITFTLTNSFKVMEAVCNTEEPFSRYARFQSRHVDTFNILDSRITFSPSQFFVRVDAVVWNQ